MAAQNEPESASAAGPIYYPARGYLQDTPLLSHACPFKSADKLRCSSEPTPPTHRAHPQPASFVCHSLLSVDLLGRSLYLGITSDLKAIFYFRDQLVDTILTH